MFLMVETVEELQESAFSEICSVLAKCRSAKEIEDFLVCLCTPNERLDLAKRWLSVKELYSGTPQREIARKFNMSLCKITRGSKELHKEDSAFKKVLEGLENGAR